MNNFRKFEEIAIRGIVLSAFRTTGPWCILAFVLECVFITDDILLVKFMLIFRAQLFASNRCALSVNDKNNQQWMYIHHVPLQYVTANVLYQNASRALYCKNSNFRMYICNL